VFPAPPAVGGLTAMPSYGRNLLTWSSEDDPNLAGWRIWRAETRDPLRARDSSQPQWVQLGDVWPAPPRFHDDTALPGRRYSYRVAALSLGGKVGPRSAAVSATAMDGSETQLPRYQIALSVADQLFIDKNILLQPDEEVPATFTFEGASRPAEVRYRGATARRFSKKSWTLKFGSAEAFQGRRDFNLKAHFIDPSLVREAVGVRLFDAVGAAAFAVQPVHLEVNGVYLGVFNEAEEIDETFLAVRDRDTGGDIFKAESNMTLLATPDLYAQRYEKKTNEATGHAALIQFIEFLNAPPTPTFVADLADVFDVDAFLSYLAVTAWIADKDSTVKNYYLHQDLSLDRWEVLPWDIDLTLGLLPNNLHLSILYGNGAGGETVQQLRVRVLAEPALLWRYCQKLTEMEARFANPSWLNPRIAVAYQTRRAGAHADPYKFGWESELPFEESAAGLLDYAAVRAPIVDAEVASVQPATPPTAVWINELSATTQTLVVDEQGEFEDWVELYNASSAPVDVGGMYLTDDLSDPTQWQIPAGDDHPRARPPRRVVRRRSRRRTAARELQALGLGRGARPLRRQRHDAARLPELEPPVPRAQLRPLPGRRPVLPAARDPDARLRQHERRQPAAGADRGHRDARQPARHRRGRGHVLRDGLGRARGGGAPLARGRRQLHDGRHDRAGSAPLRREHPAAARADAGRVLRPLGRHAGARVGETGRGSERALRLRRRGRRALRAADQRGDGLERDDRAGRVRRLRGLDRGPQHVGEPDRHGRHVPERRPRQLDQVADPRGDDDPGERLPALLGR
jgi:hypothetical protein